MQLVQVPGIDMSQLVALVSSSTRTRGAEYARNGAVMHLEWDADTQVLGAVVRGSGRETYQAAAYFRSNPTGRLSLVRTECSCPVGLGCKHAVAAVITASTGASGAVKVPPPAPAQHTWDQHLTDLLPSGPTGDATDIPLAIELTLSRPGHPGRSGGHGKPRLHARLVRPGRTGWVNGGMTWSRLDSPYALGECRADHVRLLRELYALHRSSSGGVGYYSSRDERTIDLATFTSRRLWPFLDEAAEIGIQLLHARHRLGPVPHRDRVALCLDVTTGDTPGSLTVTPVLRPHQVGGLDGDLVPVVFLGADGHGLVCAPRAVARGAADPAGWPLRLVRLDQAVSSELQRMAMTDGRVTVPAGQRQRFHDEFAPRLQRLAPLVSSDGSFTAPEISEPTLVVHADYGDGHHLALRCEWSYRVGDTELRASLDGADTALDGLRNIEREREIDTSVQTLLSDDGIRGASLAALDGAVFDGVDTMRFASQVLPMLADTPGVVVESTGEPAAYREVGDSLRIGVSTEDVPGDRDWFDLGVTITVEGKHVPFAQVFAALAADKPHLLLADGAYFSLHKPELQALRMLIDEARALADAPSGELRISRFQAGLWEEFAALGVVEGQAQAWQRQVGGLLSLDGFGDTDVPGTVLAQLRPYQRDGFDWLCFLWRHGLGGILADDMGLGKTLQSLALICHAKDTDPAMAPFLIVAPTSVVANWAAEAERFAPSLSVVTITDTVRRRGQDLADVVAGADVVVTSYTLFRLDAASYSAQAWSGLVLDEAQFTKNHQSKIYQCARQLPAAFKLAITGTPMENNLMELWSLLSITAPGLFPSPTRFREHYARPIERDHDAELLGRLRRRIRPLLKRRTKEQVAADLPAKQEQVVDVELDSRHRRIYQQHLQRERQKVLGLIDDMNKNRFTILRSLTLMRQLSLHPGLVDPQYEAIGSSKIDALVEHIEEVADGGHRALVFSQFTGYLSRVRERFDAAGIEYCYLDGSTRKRADVVRAFREGSAPVFLISLKAGGVGLNLTEADYCFLLDPWWNPATEAQAIDRTHRIGQTRNVMVYRMIAKDTIEEKVFALAQRKAELFTSVLDDGALFGSTLGVDDIRELLA